MTKEQNADLAIIEATNREAWKRSLFWHIDHPRPDDIDRRRPPKPTSTTTLLEGAREALKAAERVLATAQRNMANAGRIAMEAAERAKIEHKPYMANAVAGVIKADLQRALSEVRHWLDVVQHYERQANEGQPQITTLTRHAFTPPWHGEEVAPDDVPF